MTKQIESTTLSDIIMRNTDTKSVQADVFVAAERHSSDTAAEDPTALQLVIGSDADRATIAGGPADDTIVAARPDTDRRRWRRRVHIRCERCA